MKVYGFSILFLILMFQYSTLAFKLIKKRQAAGYGCDKSIDMTPIAGSGCSKFWRCDGERLFEFACGQGTLFDPKTKLCNWPHRVKCTTYDQSSLNLVRTGPDFDDSLLDSSVLSRIINKNETDSEEDECNKLNLTSQPDDCSQYYLCIESILTKQTCPPGTLFSNKMKNCNWESEVECEEKSGESQSVAARLAQSSSSPSAEDNSLAETTQYISSTFKMNENQSIVTFPLIQSPTTSFSICPQFETADTKQAFCSLKSFRDDYPNCCF